MLTFSSYLKEARRNPDLNPKVPINQRVKQHLENADKLRDANIPNSFVSFTSVDKLGINPGSRYDTPLGIYCYPSFYVYDTVGDSKSMKKLPFVGGVEFANIFSVQGTVLNLNTISSCGLSKLYERISEMYIRRMGIRRGTNEWKEAVDYLEMEIFDAAPYHAKFNSNGGLFWWVTKEMANIFSTDGKPRKEFNFSGKSFKAAKRHAVVWNQIFRDIGIDGCVDADGEGIIHTSERTQAVFFSKSVIKEFNRYYNKYAPDDVESKRQIGKNIVQRKAKEKEKIDSLVSKVNKIQNLEAEEMFEYIKSDEDVLYPINTSIGKKLIEQIESTEFKKLIIMINISNYHFSNDPQNYFYIRDKIAPTLSNQDVADIANHEIMNTVISELPYVINLKKNMDLSLIDSLRFRSLKYTYDNPNGVANLAIDLALGGDVYSVYSRNSDLVIKIIKMSEYTGFELRRIVNNFFEFNNYISESKLFDLGDAYIGKRTESGEKSYEQYFDEFAMKVDGTKVDPEVFQSVKQRLNDKYSE